MGVKDEGLKIHTYTFKEAILHKTNKNNTKINK
jgi:hypothetical protein